MGKRPLPDLPDTGRRYVDQTLRARLASPGIERYTPRRGPGRGAGATLAILVAAALVAAVLLLR